MKIHYGGHANITFRFAVGKWCASVELGTATGNTHTHTHTHTQTEIPAHYL